MTLREMITKRLAPPKADPCLDSKSRSAAEGANAGLITSGPDWNPRRLVILVLCDYCSMNVAELMALSSYPFLTALALTVFVPSPVSVNGVLYLVEPVVGSLPSVV